MTASQVAKYILLHFARSGESINNLKLQKLLYYSQAWHATLHGEPLFGESIEAWVHGPVVPSVFREYRDFKWNPIHYSHDQSACELPKGAQEHVDEVLCAYGDLSSWDLERLSHSEDPWRNARGALPPDAASNALIPVDQMRAFYGRS